MSGVHTGIRVGAGLAVFAAGAIATYPVWRPWCLTWGATSEEAAGPLPGDELMDNPTVVTTRAVTIGTRPESVWPWLVQMGPGRGGAYTYDWIENLAGLGMHSADRILPEFQDLAVGDTLRLGQRGPVLLVEILDPDRALVLRSDDGNWVWALVLAPEGAGEEVRLLSRNRITVPNGAGFSWFVTRYFMEPGSLVMERKMLLGIRDRAEGGGRREPGEDQAAEPPSIPEHAAV